MQKLEGIILIRTMEHVEASEITAENKNTIKKFVT